MIKSLSTKIFLFAIITISLNSDILAQRNYQYRNEGVRRDDSRLEQRSFGYRERGGYRDRNGFNKFNRKNNRQFNYRHNNRRGGFCAPGIRQNAYRRGLRDGMNFRRGGFNSFRYDGPRWKARKFKRSRSL